MDKDIYIKIYRYDDAPEGLKKICPEIDGGMCDNGWIMVIPKPLVDNYFSCFNDLRKGTPMTVHIKLDSGDEVWYRPGSPLSGN